jgi:hypothetical protein
VAAAHVSLLDRRERSKATSWLWDVSKEPAWEGLLLALPGPPGDSGLGRYRLARPYHQRQRRQRPANGAITHRRVTKLVPRDFRSLAPGSVVGPERSRKEKGRFDPALFPRNTGLTWLLAGLTPLTWLTQAQDGVFVVRLTRGF